MNKLNRGRKTPTNRLEDRLPSKFPIKLAETEGLTHNISASGIFFELEKNQTEGSKIEFTIELQTPGGPLNLVCQAEVVRVQELNGKYGIAAKITSQEFQSIAVNKSNQ